MKKIYLLLIVLFTSVPLAAYSNDTPVPLFDSPTEKTIDTETIDMINSTTDGGEILGAFFFINEVIDSQGRSLTQALIDAASRGVKIHILSESIGLGNANVMNSELLSYPNVLHTECLGGCMYGPSSKAIMHNKFWVVRKNSHDGYYVSIGSHNYNPSQQNRHQQTLIFEDDVDVYNIIRNYFNDLISYKNTVENDYYHTQKLPNAKFYFFPINSDDTITRILNNINPSEGSCEIHITMGTWTTTRDGILSKLKELSNEGCSVNTIIDSNDGNPAINAFRSKGSDAEHHNVNVIAQPKIHSKYLLVHAHYDGSEQHLTWSGSHNFSNNALRRHDETLVKTYSTSLYDEFLDNWRSIPECETDLNTIKSSLTISNKQINAPGNDKLPQYANGEWIDFTVTGNTCIDLSGWKISDSQGHYSHFPVDTIIDSGQTIRLFSGCKNYPTNLDWTSEAAYSYFHAEINTRSSCAGVWNNEGDTITLEDSQGDIIIQESY